MLSIKRVSKPHNNITSNIKNKLFTTKQHPISEVITDQTNLQVRNEEKNHAIRKTTNLYTPALAFHEFPQ